MKKSVLVCFCLFASTIAGQPGRRVTVLHGDNLAPRASIETIDAHRTSITVTIPSITLYDIESDGVAYQKIDVQGFSFSADLGLPELPVVQFSLVVPPGMEPRIRVIKNTDTVIGNVNVAPVLDWGVIRPDHSQNSNVARNESVYSGTSLYPSDIARIRETGSYRGNNIAFFEVYPITFHPDLKEVTLSKHLRLMVTMTPKHSGAEIRGGGFPGEAPLRIRYGGPVAEGVDGAAPRGVLPDAGAALDILIITIPALKPAADSLALWHAMKGYETRIVTSSSWTTASVKDSVTSYYKKTTPPPKYLLIIGDAGQVPLMKTSFLGETAHIDYDYALMDGSSDKIPDLARGRLPVNTIAEANAVVRKIVTFEKTPPTTPSFYSTILAAACFSPQDGSTTTEHEGYRFSKTVEDARTYLAGKSYTVTRAYVTESANVTPKKWWSGNSLVDVPFELQKPQFAWNANAVAINTAIDGGVFLAYHYDHGYAQGWADPSWTVSTMTLKNKELLPVVYSINCETGMLQNQAKCFAEKLICAASGGAVAVVAASAVTYAEPNIVFTKALIEATWPGYAGDGRIESPVYALGDVLDKAILRLQSFDIFTRKEYLLFGDPTTKLFTRLPSAITVTHPAKVEPNAKSLALSALSIDNGIATLVDTKTATCLGKVRIQGPTAQLPVNGPISDTAALVLTITSDNCRPYQSAVNGPAISVKNPGVQPNRSVFLLRLETMPPVALDPSETVVVTIYTTIGKTVYARRIDNVRENVTLAGCLRANGMYYVRVHSVTGKTNRYSKLLWNK